MRLLAVSAPVSHSPSFLNSLIFQSLAKLHSFSALPSLLQMCAKKGSFDPKSTLALLRSYAEISSVHGEILILLHNCLLIFQEFSIC